MRSTKKTTAIVLAGAVGISSVAYGVGTQVDGGSSVAAAGNKAGAQRALPRRLWQPRCDWASSRRPVMPCATTTIQHANMRASFAAALANALGKSTEDSAALDSLESERRARFAAGWPSAERGGRRGGPALEELKDERPVPAGPARR